MDKNDLIELLYRSLDQELSTSESNVLNEGLEKDAELRELHAELRAMRSALSTLSVQENHSELADRVLGVASEDDLSNALWVTFRRVALVAGLAFAFILGYGMFTQGNSNYSIDDEHLLDDVAESIASNTYLDH